MALIKCPECGREISDQAAACPNCGYDIRAYLKKEQSEEAKRSISEKFARSKKKIMIVVCVLVAIIGIVGGIIYVSGGMPDITGIDIRDAKTKLDERDIKYTTEYAYTKDFEKGYGVWAKCKPYARYESGEKVILQVSKGKEYTMPDIIGENIEGVQDILNSISYEPEYCYTYDKEEGTIIDSSVSVGNLFNEDSPVHIKISKGFFKKLDKLDGKSLTEVKEYLDGLGLNYTVKEDFDNNIEKGTVVSYSPMVYGEAGETIKLFVSKGKGIKIPKVTGMSLAEAKEKLLAQGLNANVKYVMEDMFVICGEENGDKVIEQDVSGTIEADAGVDTITLSVSIPSIKVTSMDFDLNYVGGVDTYITLKNNSDKQIAYVEFDVKYYDSMGYPARCSIRNTSAMSLQYTGPLNPGHSSGRQYWDAVIYDSTTAALRPLAAVITFTDNTKQKLTYEVNGQYKYWTLNNYYGGELHD